MHGDLSLFTIPEHASLTQDLSHSASGANERCNSQARTTLIASVVVARAKIELTIMPNEITPLSSPTVEAPSEATAELTTESFGELLAQFENAHSQKDEGGTKQLEGTVVSIDADSLYLDDLALRMRRP
jgi:hypothetical protein